MHKCPQSVFDPLTSTRMLIYIFILSVLVMMGSLIWLAA